MFVLYLDPVTGYLSAALLIVIILTGGISKKLGISKKIVEGRLKKFYSEVVLLEQTFVLDGETKVIDGINKLSKELGSDIQIKNFTRFNLGEGIEKDEKSFADEVAEQLSNQ